MIVATLKAPADSPAIVMLFGSPPKLSMLFRTHPSAAIWSRMPLIPDVGAADIRANPSAPSL